MPSARALRGQLHQVLQCYGPVMQSSLSLKAERVLAHPLAALSKQSDAKEGGALARCKVPPAIIPEATLTRNDQIIKRSRCATDSNTA